MGLTHDPENEELNLMLQSALAVQEVEKLSHAIESGKQLSLAQRQMLSRMSDAGY